MDVAWFGEDSTTIGHQKQTGGRSRPSYLALSLKRPTPPSSPPPQTTPAPPSLSPARSQASPRGEALPPAAGGGGTRAVPGERTAGLFPKVGRAGPAVVGVRPSPARCARALSQRERVEIRADRCPGSVARCPGSVVRYLGSAGRCPGPPNGAAGRSPGSAARCADRPSCAAGSGAVVRAVPA